ncbi:MAG TPA: heterodisulfide reductase-related iron-sulfur binding cluster [Verrucomicrobiae bacterium]|jgi:glycolate oxidase iron-sulfur subunit
MSATAENFLDEKKALACIHCGLCLSACPTYLETGNENDSPRGRIYLMRGMDSGRLPVGGAAVEHIDRCLGCRACEVACPSGVQYGALLEQTRDHIERHTRRSIWQTFLRRIAIEQIFPFPWRMRLALFPARIVRRLGLENELPHFFRELLSLVPDQIRTFPVPEISPALAEKKGRVAVVSGCVMSVLFSRTNAATVRLLSQLGYEVVTPKNQVCCGALYAHSGRLDRARASARKNIEVFEAANVDTIVINAAGCGSTLKEYGHLLHDDPKYAARAAQFSKRVIDLTELLAAETALEVNPRLSSYKTTYHDACHLAHAQRITLQPRELVMRAAGRNYVELPESDVCCGSAGTYNITEPDLAERLQNRKIQNILASGAEVVVTTNPGCILQMRAGLKKAGAHDVKVIHIADYLA